ncbi:2-dehydro-3-deoxygalactonokinase [Maribacter sp. 1_MG-2023]|uniref:2-dehydro-3-deoxygalactonokinase n=1 Tax=Maribacter sp. 1_MG-2023 TaxID=3062677 RepID=UPI0026E49030|nr:2-dehydro-3-deoxygalactonokinase [Maribacter sp. 1_MG-2023]MDO6473365.1 2-dehydro-3-deoxygalactonokinase [Maribacter sp. 1_MG-2023]
MKIPDYFISCDWGTSNFRLRLVETETLNVLVEHKTDQGVKIIYQKFLQQNEIGRTQFFKNYLESQISNLGENNKAGLVIAAGMASSNIGMQNLPYGQIPFNTQGDGLLWQVMSFKENLAILLISGVKTESGMMRGEEIQAFGLAKYLESYQSGILILPGTHSKHIDYKKGEFSTLKSFMTGEVFELFSCNSILSNSVEKCHWINKRHDAFKQGLEIGFSGELSANLFSIRARHILNDANKKDNYYLLSGMLIGDELSYLKGTRQTIFLAATEPFYSMYKLALETFLKDTQVICFGDKVLEKALLIGQKKIIQIHAK